MPDDEIFTTKHKRLERIAKTANIFAWLVLFFYVFRVASEIYVVYTAAIGYKMQIENNVLWVINALLDIIYILFIGIVYWLVLKGVSMGLKMILDIDINYHLMSLGEKNE